VRRLHISDEGVWKGLRRDESGLKIHAFKGC